MDTQSMVMVVLSALAFVSAAVHIYSDRKGMRHYAYVFKPLTMVLLLLIAVFAAKEKASVYGLAIIAGIVFSLVGDVAMMLLTCPLRLYHLQVEIGRLLLLFLLVNLTTSSVRRGLSPL